MILMRNTKCRFCSKIFNNKQKYCNHVAEAHNDQVPEGCEPLEFAYSLLVNKPMGRLCVMCKEKPVKFNDSSLKYERFCSNPACKEAYVKMMKERMVKVYGKEHLLNEASQQRKMLYNHHDAKDYIWDEKHKFRIIGSYEADFLDKLKSLGWSPDDIICPSPQDFWYKWGDGTQHLYIPDFFLPSLNLHVEIKQGGFNDSYMEHNRDIEHRKDAMMEYECGKIGQHYIKIMDKKYDEFINDYVKSDNNRPE